VDAADRTALPIAGNDPRAKRQAAELLSLLGYDSVDVGPLTESWRSQLGTPVFCAPCAVTKDDQYRTQPPWRRRRVATRWLTGVVTRSSG
jgi:8-hydroxy-5-deazaflavin:NADPH oxidoreductase